jgi:hypothetical protein
MPGAQTFLSGINRIRYRRARKPHGKLGTAGLSQGGTSSSNPLSSTGESGANLSPAQSAGSVLPRSNSSTSFYDRTKERFNVRLRDHSPLGHKLAVLTIGRDRDRLAAEIELEKALAAAG